MVLIDDFFLVFDEMEGSFRARVTGSPKIVIKYVDLKNNERLFDELIVRRFAQFTGAYWTYDCLADLGRGLPGASVLCLPETRKFADITIDLFPMSFRMLFSCAVGYLDIDDHTYYDVGMGAFGWVIAFKRSENGIAEPEMLEGLVLESDDSQTEGNRFLIGGGNHDLFCMSGMGCIPEVGREERSRSPFSITRSVSRLGTSTGSRSRSRSDVTTSSDTEALPVNVIHPPLERRIISK